MSLTALDPQPCSRCRREVPADDPARPESISSHVYAPVRPRPVLGGGARPDGTVVAPREVDWQIEADYERRGAIAALLCQPCIEQLRQWLYLPPTTAAQVRAEADGPPANGDWVRLTYRDGSTVEGRWQDGVLTLPDGTEHTHTRGQVRNDVLIRAGAR